MYVATVGLLQSVNIVLQLCNGDRSIGGTNYRHPLTSGWDTRSLVFINNRRVSVSEQVSLIVVFLWGFYQFRMHFDTFFWSFFFPFSVNKLTISGVIMSYFVIKGITLGSFWCFHCKFFFINLLICFVDFLSTFSPIDVQLSNCYRVFVELLSSFCRSVVQFWSYFYLIVVEMLLNFCLFVEFLSKCCRIVVEIFVKLSNCCQILEFFCQIGVQLS